MITYHPFWQTLKTSSETTYTLIHHHNISSSTIDRLRKHQPLTTNTLNELCRILHCDVSDIIDYRPSDEESAAP